MIVSSPIIVINLINNNPPQTLGTRQVDQ